MRKKLVIGLLLLAASTLLAIVPAFADEVDINAQLRSRSEYLDNFDDFDDDAGTSVDFTTYQVRLGLDFGFSDTVSASLEVMHNGNWGDSNIAGTGDPTIDSTANVPGKDETLLYQGFIDWKKVGGSLFGVRVGRQEHTLGNELHMGDNDFYSGQVFDGVRATLDLEMTDLDVFYYTITERDVVAPGGIAGSAGSNDTNLAGVAAKFIVAPGQSVEPYLFYYRNGLEAVAEDHYTLGALYGRPPSEDGAFDWSAEAAIQSGDTTFCPPTATGPECDLSSYIVEGWFGWSFGDENSHRVHGGLLLMSGGGDTQDNEAFRPLFTDTHGRAGALDLFSGTSNSAIPPAPGTSRTFNNLTVLDVGYEYSTGPHSVSAAYLDFTFTENVGQGTDVGGEIDVIYDYETTKHIGLQAGVAMFMPGNAFAPTDDDALRVWAMLRVRK